jgi:hypothetical protein
LTTRPDNLTLEEYLATLSNTDKELLKGFPLTVDELVDIEEEELDRLKIRHGLTKEEQTRRSEIISKIKDLRIFAILEREARQHQWYGDSNGNGRKDNKDDNNQFGNKREGQNKPNDNVNGKKQQPLKRQFIAYKYSNKGKGPLYEAVILAGRPVFMKYANGNIESYDTIEEDTRIFKLPNLENYPYDSYEFENTNEIFAYLERAKKESVDSLYRQSKQIALNYNDQNRYKIQLLAIDIIWTYFQDRFPTTHYEIILGSPGSGKSSYGETFTATGYRVVNLTDPNAANINRILGTVELGQCTFVSDETGAIDKHPELMALLKTGYSIKGKISKINDYSRVPEFFFTYCFKMIIAERMPNLKDAKGVYDRSFSFTAFKGLPKYDIKETLEPQHNPARQERLDTLNDFRKLLLVYRLLHFEDQIDDIDVGVEGREKELSKPIVQLFHGSAAQKEVEETLQYFLNQRNEKKDTTLEPVLHPIVTKLLSTSKTNEIYLKQVWDSIISGELGGLYDEKKPNQFESEDYGTIYRNQIGTILEHTFGGLPKHREKGNTYAFDPVELARVGKVYNLKTSIQTKIVIEDDPEHPEGIEDTTETLPAKNEGNSYSLRGKNCLERADNRDSHSKEPSACSASSAPNSISNHPKDFVTNSTIYRLGHSDNFACKNCKVRGDKFFMETHVCRGESNK